MLSPQAGARFILLDLIWVDGKAAAAAQQQQQQRGFRMGADDARRSAEGTAGGTTAAAAVDATAVGGQDLVETGGAKGRTCSSGGGGTDAGGGGCSAGNVYTTATTAVTGLKLCLSVANAVANLGFKFNTLRRAVFGGAAVVEAIGLLFAVNMAHERWVCDDGGDDGGYGSSSSSSSSSSSRGNSSSSGSSRSEGMRGSGSPIMIIWEAPAAPFGADWVRKRNDAVMLGLGAQALAFWYCMTVHWYLWGLSGGAFAGAVAVAWSATVVVLHAYQHQRVGEAPVAKKQSGEHHHHHHHHALVGAGSTVAAGEGRNCAASACRQSSCCCLECLARTVPAVLVALLPPIAINVAESVLIFTGTFTPAAYLLAVLDLVLVIPVVHYVVMNFSRLACNFQKGSV